MISLARKYTISEKIPDIEQILQGWRQGEGSLAPPSETEKLL